MWDAQYERNEMVSDKEEEELPQISLYTRRKDNALNGLLDSAALPQTPDNPVTPFLAPGFLHVP